MESKTPPDWFVRALHAQFSGRLRIRWSRLRQRWQIEQRVARAIDPGHRIREIDDALLRARDGFDLFCEVTDGDRTPCPTCATEIRLRPYVFAEATCPRCAAQKRESRTTVAYFPLSDRLLEHLRLCDPERVDVYARLRALDEGNARQEATTNHDFTTLRQDILKDGLIHEQIPKIGYTGRPRP